MGLKSKIAGLIELFKSEEKDVRKTGSDEKVSVSGVGEKKGTQVLAGYVLWYQPEGGGKREKVQEFDYLPSVDELEADYIDKPGTWFLQEIWIDKGLDGTKNIKQFGKIVWKQRYVWEEEDEDEEIDEVDYSKKRRRRSRRRKGGLLEAIEMLKEAQEELEELSQIGAFLARLGGKNIVELPEGQTMEDYVINMMEQLKQKKERLDRLFGESKLRDKEAELPIEGKIPAWMVYAPKLFEQVMDNVEKRLQRLGLIGDESSKIKVPEFPKL